MERLSILYASALFDIASDNNSLSDFMKQASMVVELFEDKECMRVLVHPHISASEKRDFFNRAFEGHIHESLLGFLHLTADKNREAFLIPALKALIGMIERHEGKVTAEVISAVAYEDTQIAALKDMLSRKLSKDVRISMKVDASIIGGPYIFVDGYYLDWTVKKRLRDLTVHMKEGCSA